MEDRKDRVGNKREWRQVEQYKMLRKERRVGRWRFWLTENTPVDRDVREYFLMVVDDATNNAYACYNDKWHRYPPSSTTMPLITVTGLEIVRHGPLKPNLKIEVQDRIDKACDEFIKQRLWEEL